MSVSRDENLPGNLAGLGNRRAHHRGLRRKRAFRNPWRTWFEFVFCVIMCTKVVLLFCGFNVCGSYRVRLAGAGATMSDIAEISKEAETLGTNALPIINQVARRVSSLQFRSYIRKGECAYAHRQRKIWTHRGRERQIQRTVGKSSCARAGRSCAKSLLATWRTVQSHPNSRMISTRGAALAKCALGALTLCARRHGSLQ